MQPTIRLAPVSGPNWGKPLCAFRRSLAGVGVAALCGRPRRRGRRLSRSWVFLRGLASDYFPGENAAGLICRRILTAASARHARAPRHARPRARRSIGAGGQRRDVPWHVRGRPLGARRRRRGRRTCSTGCRTRRSLMLIGGLRGSGHAADALARVPGRVARHVAGEAHPRRRPAPLRAAEAARAHGASSAGSAPRWSALRAPSAASSTTSPSRSSRRRASEPCPGDATAGVRHAREREARRWSRRETSADFFLLGRQASLDVRSLPHVLAGSPYDDVDDARAEWNAWLDGADWTSHFDKAAVDAQKMDVSAPGAAHMPAVEVPGSGGDGARAARPRARLRLPVRSPDRSPSSSCCASPSCSRGNIRLDPAAELDEDGLTRATSVTRRPAEELGHERPAVKERPCRRARRSAWHRGRQRREPRHLRQRGRRGCGAPRAARHAALRRHGRLGRDPLVLHPDAAYHHLRFIAPTVLDERFADSPIVVTIPLFTFVGYVLAEAKTPDRLVDAARTVLGWMPGGLAIVCIIASAIFTVLTGGSGVTIIAIGGLLYPALRKQGYSEAFSLGLVTTGGSVGLLLPARCRSSSTRSSRTSTSSSCSRRSSCPGAARHRAPQHLRGVRRRAENIDREPAAALTRCWPPSGTSSGSSASRSCSSWASAPGWPRSTRRRASWPSTSSSSSSSSTATSTGRRTSSASPRRR